jgi:hypothetical protein
MPIRRTDLNSLSRVVHQVKVVRIKSVVARLAQFDCVPGSSESRPAAFSSRSPVTAKYNENLDKAVFTALPMDKVLLRSGVWPPGSKRLFLNP